MSRKKDELWSGGSWEQPTSRYRPPDTPDGRMRDHIKLSQSMRRIRRRTASVLKGMATILLTGCVLAGIVAVAVTHPASPLYLNPFGGIIVGGGSGGGYGGGGDVAGSSNPAMVFPSMTQADYLTEDLLTIQSTTGSQLTPQENYLSNQKSVVYIESLSNEGLGAGTGIVVSEDGYIVTNAHVISGAMETMVTLWDETSYTATLVGWNGDEDLAVIKIDAENLTPAVFGDSDDLQVGDPAYAIGNPLGAEYRTTFTDGIVSALNRYLDIDGVFMSLIQTTAPINMGNSGGALLNQYGQVVGVTTIKIMSSVDTVESMGFAIPSQRVVRVINWLARGETIQKPAMGVTVLAVADPVQGLRVEEMTQGGYGQSAGILVGDIITSAQGETMYTTNDLARVLSTLLVGDTVHIELVRDGEAMELDVLLGEYTDIYPE